VKNKLSSGNEKDIQAGISSMRNDVWQTGEWCVYKKLNVGQYG
jgi:hypothetical protein